MRLTMKTFMIIFSFDILDSGKTRLFAADVGQSMMEEIDLVEPGGNYGWPIREGTTCFNAQAWSQPLESCSTQGLSDPIIAYAHPGDLSAVIGGMVYRGKALPELSGGYVFGGLGKGKGSSARRPSTQVRFWKMEGYGNPGWGHGSPTWAWPAP